MSDRVLRFPVAERFKAVQGEGVFTGTMMAFVRLVGCSVGQSVCTACDTDFDKSYPALGGGLYTVDELLDWAHPVQRICLTGGEPLDRDIRPILLAAKARRMVVHIETSGTKLPDWLILHPDREANVLWGDSEITPVEVWVACSPKPGWLPSVVLRASELKVILGGLGDGPGWPTVSEAVAWHRDYGKVVYVQPRNHRLDVNMDNIAEALRVVEQHPGLRLSCQLHKFIRTR